MLRIGLILLAFTLSGCLSGETDPKLEYEHSNPPTWNDCYRLAWVRGVHVELGELNEQWMAECMSGRVPFSIKADDKK